MALSAVDRLMGRDVVRALAALSAGAAGIALLADGVERGWEALAWLPLRLAVAWPLIAALAGVGVGTAWARAGRWTAVALVGRDPQALSAAGGRWALAAGALAALTWGARPAEIAVGPLSWSYVGANQWVQAASLDEEGARGLALVRLPREGAPTRLWVEEARYDGGWSDAALSSLPSPEALRARPQVGSGWREAWAAMPGPARQGALADAITLPLQGALAATWGLRAGARGPSWGLLGLILALLGRALILALLAASPLGTSLAVVAAGALALRPQGGWRGPASRAG